MSLWLLAWQRFRRDPVGVASAAVVLVFILVAAGSAAGWLARDWSDEVAVSYAAPLFLKNEAREEQREAASSLPQNDYGIADPLAAELAEIRSRLTAAAATDAKAGALAFGADKWGRDVLKKAIKGTETSLLVGFAAAALATLLGTLFGAFAGYYGRWVDDFFNWLYSVFTSIPYLLLVLAVAAVLGQKGILTVILILGLTGWTGIFRLVRAEYLKHRVREYVLAADSVGASDLRRMFAHILPNVSHVVLVQLSLHVVLFVKSEVILSFLGFGVGVDTVSWGSMLAEAPSELILGMWWQIAAATIAMALAVTAFGLFTDAVRDALDPRLQ
ncbi:MAG TPA: ABC transporter permease [Burkholderiales bacterium]|nr:ABC transporter permease [Burkholderiales bacterium]